MFLVIMSLVAVVLLIYLLSYRRFSPSPSCSSPLPHILLSPFLFTIPLPATKNNASAAELEELRKTHIILLTVLVTFRMPGTLSSRPLQPLLLSSRNPHGGRFQCLHHLSFPCRYRDAESSRQSERVSKSTHPLRARSTNPHQTTTPALRSSLPCISSPPHQLTPTAAAVVARAHKRTVFAHQLEPGGPVFPPSLHTRVNRQPSSIAPSSQSR